jgi:hypothetical protein
MVSGLNERERERAGVKLNHLILSISSEMERSRSDPYFIRNKKV